MTLDKSLIERETMLRYCTKYEVEYDDDEETNDIADRLEASIRVELPMTAPNDPVPEVYQVVCGVCGGDSGSDDECCPYCGTVDEVEEEVAEEEVAEEEVPEPAQPPPPKATPKAKPLAKAKDAAPKGKKHKRSEAQISLVVETPDPADDDAIDASVDAAMGDRSPMSDALVPQADVLVEMQSALTSPIKKPRNIKAAIDAVLDAKRLHVVSHWHLGHAILQCFEGDLWKQMRGESGNPRFKGFGAFCEAELKLSSRYCYTLMEISAQFAAHDVAQIGVAKLGQILKVAPAQRAELLEIARDGKPLSDIAKQVQALVLRNGTSGAGSGKKDNTKAREAAAAKSKMTMVTPDDVITTTHEKRKFKIELFAKVPGKDGTAKRAKRLADSPVGMVVALNGITIKYALTVDAKGQLVLIVEHVRPE